MLKAILLNMRTIQVICKSRMLQKIDNLVYRLYDLTYDEVKVIDPEFGMSEGEYVHVRAE